MFGRLNDAFGFRRGGWDRCSERKVCLFRLGRLGVLVGTPSDLRERRDNLKFSNNNVLTI